jgi:hypothetical protein
MKSQLLFTTIVSGLLAITAAPVFASLSIPNGWYIEGNVGPSKISDQNINGSVSNNGVGLNANIGYKFMPYLTTEIGYTQYADTKIKDQFGTTAATDKHYSYGVTAKGIVPVMASGFEAFAKLGVQRSVSSMSVQDMNAANNVNLNANRHSNIGLSIGAGAQYYFMPELAGILQWARAKNDDNTGTFDLYSVGLSIIFE